MSEGFALPLSVLSSSLPWNVEFRIVLSRFNLGGRGGSCSIGVVHGVYKRSKIGLK